MYVIRATFLCGNTCGVQVKDLTRALSVGRREKAPGHGGTLGHALAVDAGRARHLAQLGTGVYGHVGLAFRLLGRELLLVGLITLPLHNQTFRHVIFLIQCESQKFGKSDVLVDFNLIYHAILILF